MKKEEQPVASQGKADKPAEASSSARPATPARLAVGRAGTRPDLRAWLEFRRDHAIARDAVKSELSEDFLAYAQKRGLPVAQSLVSSREEFVLYPPMGKSVTEDTLEELKKRCPTGRDVQIVIADGLSAQAVETNVPDLLPVLEDGLAGAGISTGLPVVVRFGRVAVADSIAHALGARLAVNLIGERPGLSSGVGLSAYITYRPGPETISSDRTVVSNIQEMGTPAMEAGAYIVHLIREIFEHGVSGVKLQEIL